MSGDLVLAWATLVSTSGALIVGGVELARRRRRASGRARMLFSGVRRRRPPARAAPEIPPFPSSHRLRFPRAMDAGRQVGWTPPGAGAPLSVDDDDVVTVRFGGLDGGVYVSRHTGPGSRGSAAPAVSRLSERATPLPAQQRLRSVDPPPPLVVELLPVDAPLHKPWIIPDVGPADAADSVETGVGDPDPDPDDGGEAGILV